MTADACSKCGSQDRKRGKLCASSGTPIEFREEETSPLFILKKDVVVIGCNACGHVEMILREREKRAA